MGSSGVRWIASLRIKRQAGEGRSVQLNGPHYRYGHLSLLGYILVTHGSVGFMLDLLVCTITSHIISSSVIYTGLFKCSGPV